MKRIVFIMMALVAISFSSCGNSKSQEEQQEKSFNYKAEAKELGFPTGEIDHWIGLAKNQYNCEAIEVTSVEADGEWCLKLYVNATGRNNFREEPVTKKAVISLWYEPSDGSIWSGDMEFL